MKRHSVRLFAAVSAAALVLASQGGAQCAGRESRGPFAGVPLGTVMHNEVGYSAGQVYLEPAGLDGAAPTDWPAALLPRRRPDFDFNQILRAGGPGCAPTSVPVIDAISIGEDWVISTCDGKIPPLANRWAAILFSVKKGSMGQTGSTLRAEHDAGTESSSVFSYVLPQSSLPAEMVGTTQRAMEPREMGLSDDSEIGALDLFMPYHALDDRIANRVTDPNPGMMLPTSTVFFSLTAASALTAPQCWFRRAAPSGATILFSDWDPLTRTWSRPREFFTYDELGLDVREDIDALAIDVDSHHMRLSTDITIVPRDPILFVTWNPACPNDASDVMDYTEQDGTLVSVAVGLTGGDDVDAICAMDPVLERRVSQFPRRNNSFYVHGTPFPTVAPPVIPVPNASAFRHWDPTSGTLSFKTILTGWPNGVEANGFGGCALTPTGLLAPFVLFAVFPRVSPPTFCGDPTEACLNIPPNPALLGADFMFRWYATSGNGIVEAYPLRVNL